MVKRYITPYIDQSLKQFPAILLTGARQIGKSTLAKQLVAAKIFKEYVTLDDLMYLEAARANPDGFLATLQESVVLDEVQRVPDLMRALKKTIDDDRRPGRFLLTGSANVLAHPTVKESLAGRMDVMHLEGMCVGELLEQSKPSTFLSDIFSTSNLNELLLHWKSKQQNQPIFNKKILRDYIFYGGFPEIALKHDTSFRQRWFASYQMTYIERDVRDLTRFLDTVAFTKLFRIAALHTTSQLNVKNLAADCGIDQRTTSRYLELLEMLFQFNQLPPWHRNIRKRLVKTNKLYMNDSGFASYLSGINKSEQIDEHLLTGALVETWVWAELRKLLALDPTIQASYYRTHSGNEVDFILEQGQQTCGIEVKWSTNVTLKDFKGLLDFQDACNKKTLGIILYMGNAIVPFSDSLAAVPINYLLT